MRTMPARVVLADGLAGVSDAAAADPCGTGSTASTTDFTVRASGMPSNSATASHLEQPGVAVLTMVCAGIARSASKATASANSMLAA